MDKKFSQLTWQKYSSYIFLNFKSKEIERGYYKSHYNYKSFVVLSSILFIFMLAITIILSYYFSNNDTKSIHPDNSLSLQNFTNSTKIFTENSNDTKHQPQQQFSSLISTGYLGILITMSVSICSLISWKLDKNEQWLCNFRINSLLINFSIRIFFVMFDIWFFNEYGFDIGNTLISAVLKSGFIFSYVIFFDCTFYLNGIIEIFILLANVVMNPLNLKPFQIITFIVIDLNFVLWFFYFIEKFIKDNFFSTQYALKEHNNLENVFNSLNIGVVKFKKDCEPSFINKSMYNKFLYFVPDEFKSLIINSSIKNIYEKIFIFRHLKELFRKFIFNGIDTSYSTKLHINFNSDIHEKISFNIQAGEFSNILRIILEEREYFNDYKYLGSKLLNINNEECFFEIYIRYDSVEEIYEVIYNDATRAKKIEEIKAEMKYKTIFLSKVAHEFKNPLLCVSELIKEIHEIRDLKNNNNSLISTISDIKNLCDYMLILVQDFDFLSMKEIRKNLNFHFDKTNIKDTLNFAINIFRTRAALNKKDIEIFYKIDPDVPDDIFTDEIRIKQVLINLLSNSYKFTDKGQISLHAKLLPNSDNNLIKINVIDTGCGIPKDKLSLLTTPFSKLEAKNNQHGAGLGLGIVKDMIEVLGSSLDIKSTIGKGTEISFLIDSGLNRNINHNEINENWIKVNRNNLRKDRILPQGCSTYLGKNNKNLFLIKSKNIDTKSYSLNNSFMTKEIKLNFLDEKVKGENYDFVYNNLSNEERLIDNNLPFIKNYPQIEVLTDKSFDSNIIINSESNFLKEIDFKEKIHRILVVEDEELIKKSLIRNLETYFKKTEEKYEIKSCSDGVECLNILYKNKFDKIFYDAVITDVSMNYICGNMLINIMDYLISKNALHPMKIFVSTSHESIEVSPNLVTEVFKKPLSLKDIGKIHSYLKKI
jgi:signal transduction histidine kinase/CheY-like chemotaxis protein